MNLKDALQEIIPPSDLTKLISAYDIVGDIAVIMVPEHLDCHEALIAAAILDTHKNVKTILKRDGIYSGEHRTIPLTHIAGEKKTETLCREFGVRIMLDLQTVYFSIRSGHERKRIADLVHPGEEVLVMFSGVAPYPLMIAKYSRAARITGIEINERAHDYGLQNVTLNKARNISLIHGDALQVTAGLKESFDRIIMPLPAHGDRFLRSAIPALRPSATIHFYDFKAKECFHETIELVEEQADSVSRTVRSSEVVICGHNSPQSYRICVDAIID